MIKSLTTAAIGAALAFTFGAAAALADGMPKRAAARAPAAAPAPVAAAPVAPAIGACGDNRFGGFFAGVHGGFLTLESRLNDRDFFLTGGDITHDDDAFTVGGQIGFNVQKCSVVWGVVADLSWADLENDKPHWSDYLQEYVNVSRSMDWYGSVRTRLGLAFDGLWLYTTGGIAFADFGANGSVGAYSGKLFDDTRVGWVAGVGTEYKWSDRVSIVSEVLFYDFGSDTSKLDYFGSTFRFDDHNSMWVSRIGLNFKLGDHGVRYEAAPAPMK